MKKDDLFRKVSDMVQTELGKGGCVNFETMQTLYSDGIGSVDVKMPDGTVLRYLITKSISPNWRMFNATYTVKILVQTHNGFTEIYKERYCELLKGWMLTAKEADIAMSKHEMRKVYHDELSRIESMSNIISKKYDDLLNRCVNRKYHTRKKADSIMWAERNDGHIDVYYRSGEPCRI